MKHNEFLLLVGIGIVLCGFIIFATEIGKKEYKFHCDALIGGWHPDLPHKYAALCAEAKLAKNDR
jgi:hypothetical protein